MDDQHEFGPPAALADLGDVVAMLDQRGRLAIRVWPDGPTAVVQAHQNRGPLSTVDDDVVSSGGWETAVTRWDVGDMTPRWTAHPFDGRVTALCGQGDDVLVGGADRDPAAGDDVGDRVPLGPGAVVRLDQDGRLVTREHDAAGSVVALAAGSSWMAVLDTGTGPAVTVVDPDGSRRLDTATPVSAIGAYGDLLAVAGPAGVEIHDLASGSRRDAFEHTGDTRLLAVIPVASGAVATTSEGLVTWPGQHLDPGDQPVAIASRGVSYLILWPDGTVEERHLDGTVGR